MPNFKGAGRTVDAALLRLLGNLQRRHGEAFASEAGLRKMLAEDEHLMPGQDTIRRALRRLEAQGLVAQVHLLAGGIRPDGRVCTHGTRLVRLPQCRRQARAMKVRARRAEPEQRRLTTRTLEDARRLLAGAAAVAKTVPQAPLIEERRRDGLAWLAAHAAELEGRPKAPS